MKNLKLSLALIAAACFFNSNVMAQTGLVTGTVAAINSLVVGDNVTDLELDSDMTTATTIASFTVDNNFENGWDVSFNFTNNGNFKRTGDAVHTDGISATGDATLIPMTNIGFAVSGTNGSATTPSASFDLATETVPGTYTYDSGVQSEATVGYVMNLQCQWAANTEDLQGNYSETITATLTVIDGI